MDDLTSLTDLNEKSLLDVLRKRYDNDLIYTCIGDILIAANPYKMLPIYGEEIKEEYKNLKGRDNHKPHIYIISDRAYQNLKWNGLNQCCVVSGESGAGKTESTKLLIEHIAYLCKQDSSNLNEKIIEVNPLLEAFGNAQTVINNNSSRFGKFIELMFDKNGQLEGAKISEYLLEKSRVVLHGPGEKNFHIFYYFFAGVDPSIQEANRLQAPERHRIMSDYNGEVYQSQEKWRECQEVWNNILEVMRHVGFIDEEINGIEALLTVIVHIADIEFLRHPETDGVSIKDDDTISLCADLLGVNGEKLVDSLILFKNKVGSEDIVILKNESQANDGRDALAKALYGRLFIWIVNRINHLLAPKTSRGITAGPTTWIGILDIYGFENFANNSFEQLCINIANEQLQLFFNQHIFQMELSEYEKEGVPGSDIKFVDNKPLLDLFFKTKDPPGLLAILDEESKFPQASDQTFIDKLVSNLSKKAEFQTTKGHSNFFTIRHFAGPVTYNVDGFLEKNRDTLSENITECLRESTCLIVNELFSPMSDINIGLESTFKKKMQRFSRMMNNFEVIRSQRINSTNQMKRASIMVSGKTPSNTGTLSIQRIAKTLASQFSSSLQGLIEKMISAEPHFIRCIKPNAEKASDHFDDEMVLEQLNYTGVLETVKIRKQGYSTRLLFPEFVHRYGIIGGVLPSHDKDHLKGRDLSGVSRSILQATGLTEWQIGKSKVFLRHFHTDKLNSALTIASESILRCQKFWRGTLARRKLAALRAKALVYRQAMTDLSETVEDVGKRFLECQQRSLEQDKKNAETSKAVQKRVSRAEDIKESRNRTVRGPKIPQIRESTQPPPFPTLWNPVLEAPQNDPCFVFLKESITKINTLQKDIWCKLYLMEKNAIIGKLYIRDACVTLNDSQETYTGKIIGIHSTDFEHLKIQQCQDAIKQVGAGIQISRDLEGNLFINRMSDVEVHVLGEDKVSVGRGVTKVYDIERFKSKVLGLLKSRDSQTGRIDVCKLARWTILNFALGTICAREVDLPLWISIINIHAFDLIGDQEVLEEFTSKGLTLKELGNVQNLWSKLNFMRR